MYACVCTSIFMQIDVDDEERKRIRRKRKARRFDSHRKLSCVT